MLMGSSFLLIEQLATGFVNPDKEAAVTLSPPIVLFATTAIFLLGMLIGFIEVVVFPNLFIGLSLFKRVFAKALVYASVLFVIILLTYPAASAIEKNMSYFDIQVWERTLVFLKSRVFVSTSFQLSVELIVSLLYSAISDHLGHGVLRNLITGRYNRPIEENRIFMFLDLKSSTQIAEKLGNERYFEFLKEYYNSLSKAIIDHEGEVYQYIGDEIVITWKLKKGARNNNALNTFFAMEKSLASREDFFKSSFGVIPGFKAGLHSGQVTTGEIGALKKEIFFTGDVLNVTARIQSLCKEYHSDLLISHDLYQAFDNHLFNFEDLGKVHLKGREEVIGVMALRA